MNGEDLTRSVQHHLSYWGMSQGPLVTSGYLRSSTHAIRFALLTENSWRSLAPCDQQIQSLGTMWVFSRRLRDKTGDLGSLSMDWEAGKTAFDGSLVFGSYRKELLNVVVLYSLLLLALCFCSCFGFASCASDLSLCVLNWNDMEVCTYSSYKPGTACTIWPPARVLLQWSCCLSKSHFYKVGSLGVLRFTKYSAWGQ